MKIKIKTTTLYRLTVGCSKHKKFTLLRTIPGIQKYSAMCILAEIGDDMDAFGKASHLVGWAGLRPRNDESAGKIQSRKILHGNKYLRQILVEILRRLLVFKKHF